MDDLDVEVDNVDSRYDGSQDPTTRSDQNSFAAKDEELEEATLTVYIRYHLPARLQIPNDGLIQKDLSKIRKLFPFTHHKQSIPWVHADRDSIKFFGTQNNLRILNSDCMNFQHEMPHYLPNLRELNT